MKQHILFTICASLFVFNLFGQDFDQYKPLECKGSIPKDYTTSSAEKYKLEAENIKESDVKRQEGKARKQFALETNFALDDLLQSGLVLFNDEVSNYLDEVMAKLLQYSDAGIKNKVKVYALRSPSVNAFATDRGNIFVTVGLLAQLENEAQLAYILSHELVHAEKGHSLELFLESKNLSKKSESRDVLEESIFDENWVAKCTYSKELETEADRLGLQRIFKTEYSTASLHTVFDVLKYSYLPFDEVAFDKAFFENGNYKFPNDYWQEKVTAISGEDEEADDKASTHPNIANRRMLFQDLMSKEQPGQDKNNYLVSEQRFVQARQIARFELPMLQLHRDEWPSAIYTSYLLLQQNPNNIYLEKSIAKALYLQAMAKNGTYVNENLLKTDEIEGESQQVFSLMEHLDRKETGILALRYAYLLHQKHPDDEELNGMLEGLFYELAEDYENLSSFKFSVNTDSLVEPPAPPADTTSASNTSKYAKIRAQKKQETGTDDERPYWRYALTDIMNEEAFNHKYEEALKEKKRRKEISDYRNTKEGKKEWDKRNTRIEKEGYSLGIDKVVVVNPYYLHLDIRKKLPMQYIKTEVGQDHMRQLIEEVVPKTKLNVTMLDVSDLKESQSEQFNDIRYLNEWFSEQANHYDMPLTLGTNQAQINAIAEKYGTDYFLWTGTVSLRNKNKAGSKILLGMLLYPALPYFIYKAVKPNYEMLHFAMLYDVRTGRREVLKFEYFKHKNTDDLVKSHLYDTFNQIKKKGKS